MGRYPKGSGKAPRARDPDADPPGLPDTQPLRLPKLLETEESGRRFLAAVAALMAAGECSARRGEALIKGAVAHLASVRGRKSEHRHTAEERRADTRLAIAVERHEHDLHEMEELRTMVREATEARQAREAAAVQSRNRGVDAPRFGRTQMAVDAAEVIGAQPPQDSPGADPKRVLG